MGGIVVGIDVGGARKGFHAVALSEGRFADAFCSTNVTEIPAWCQNTKAAIVGVDAPCAWSLNGRARPAEKALMQERIWCFSTPARSAAVAHPKNQFGWMLAGENLYNALSKDYELMKGDFGVGRRMFETFPHAVVCSLFGRVVSAKTKVRDRRILLGQHGIADKAIANIDFIDAAICALTAHYVARGKWRAYGDDESGRIVVPDLSSRDP